MSVDEQTLPQERPRVVVVAGPNGAGKSTVAPRLVGGALHVETYVNADSIASGLSAFAPQAVAIQAGRLMLARLRALAEQRDSFAFETTLASRTFAPWLRTMIAGGYDLEVFFLWLASPELAVSRVADRVRLGGHDVPEATIRRRYAAGLRNFWRIYRPLASSWRVYDNSTVSEPALVATWLPDAGLKVGVPPVWRDFLREASRDD